MEQTLRVKNLISSRYMQDICRVVAGKGGLGNSVSWVHILEIRDVVKDSVDEGALILTTGIGFTTKDVAVKFLCDLIESRAAGLCIETVLYYPVIDRELIEIADKEEFPLVEIYAIARFLDVSKGLNTMILNNESVLYGDAEVFDSGLANIRHIGSLEDGLRYTGEYLGVDVVFYPGEESLGTALSEAGCEVDIAPHEISSYIKRDGVFANGKIAVKKIEAFSHCFGYLVFSSATKKIDRFALLIQGRVSNHIKEQNMRILIRKEEEWRKRTKWVREWLDGNITENQIARKLREAGMFKVWQCIFVCCMEFPPTYSFAEQALCPPENDIFLYDNFFRLNTFLVRRSFEKSGFSVL
ncbi:MAG: PucR family transcriptional regulator ligand-binding domain-containing protein, partial [Clostridiales Family XIII bacterium]|nr:PucR family transcriptional regulator ligand-binding domain-containing protein [Clostridiales Family XIII bacterium]